MRRSNATTSVHLRQGCMLGSCTHTCHLGAVKLLSLQQQRQNMQNVPRHQTLSGHLQGLPYTYLLAVCLTRKCNQADGNTYLAQSMVCVCFLTKAKQTHADSNTHLAQGIVCVRFLEVPIGVTDTCRRQHAPGTRNGVWMVSGAASACSVQSRNSVRAARMSGRVSSLPSSSAAISRATPATHDHERMICRYAGLQGTEWNWRYKQQCSHSLGQPCNAQSRTKEW